MDQKDKDRHAAFQKIVAQQVRPGALTGQYHPCLVELTSRFPPVHLITQAAKEANFSMSTQAMIKKQVRRVALSCSRMGTHPQGCVT